MGERPPGYMGQPGSYCFGNLNQNYTLGLLADRMETLADHATQKMEKSQERES
jgi:hypothetical protein